MSDPAISVPNSSSNGAAAKQENVASSKQDSGLFKDKTFQAIYNAFQLGWSLYELKSRILLASFDVELQAPQKPGDQQPQPGQQNPLQAFIDDLFKQSLPVNAPPQPADEPTLFDNDRPVLPEAASENDWLRSVWRALFKQIVDLHSKCSLEENGSTGGDDTASSTLYGYPSIEKAKELYPYLYNVDYAKFGMPTTIDESKFSLPGIVYRALNCLTLLYTDPKDTLSPKTIEKYRDELLKAMADPAPDKLSAIKILSALLVKLLVTWDNYVREHLYPGGIIKNDEIELVAYEAGRSLASLPWGISVRTVVLEKMLSGKPDPKTDEPVKRRLYDVWQKVFDKRDIVHIQHQITALSQALDDAYYNVIPGAHRPDPEKDKDTVVDDPDLPTRSIHAIRHSLDYWVRSITWLGKREVQQAIRTRDNPTDANKPSILDKLRSRILPRGNGMQGRQPLTKGEVASQKSLSNPPSKDGEPKPPILTGELAHDLRVALIQQSDVWHSLMTYEQNLSNFTAESVTLNILNNFMVKFQQAMRKRFSFVPLIVGTVAFVLLLIVIVIVLPLINSSIADYLTKPPAIIALIGTVLAGGVHSVMNWLTKLRGILGTSGQVISDAFNNGYKQLLVEFSDLNYNVAVSSALTAFFIEDVAWLWQKPSNLQVVVDDAYSFLTEIVWTDQERAEEIDRVASAAFGPLGAFIGAELGTSNVAGARKA